MELHEELADLAAEHGVRLGVADLSPFPDQQRDIEDRVTTGLSASLKFTFGDPELATNPLLSFPWGRSIVVVAVPYLQDGDGPSKDRSVARFADGDRYSRLRSVLGELSHHLAFHGARTEVVFDDNRLVDRAVAIRAGIAWPGKSTMAIAPGFGPWFLIGSIVTDAELPLSKPMGRTCGTCDACIPACPTGAIVAPGVLDARRCLAAIFQSRGAIPTELRIAAGGRVYGCDDCLTSCPPGNRELGDHTASRTADPRDILVASDSVLNEAYDHWYVPGRKMRFLRRNALVALGNIGAANDVSLVEQYVEHQDPLLAEHAEWARDRIVDRSSSTLNRPSLEITEP
ncbi:MAG: epoxyqueuosine reductase [Acidimicrobiia bacterium]